METDSIRICRYLGKGALGGGLTSSDGTDET